MKLGITITYHSGEGESATVLPPEWIKWEIKTSRKITDVANDALGLSDLSFLAYHALKRQKGGTPMKPYEAWVETIADLDVEVAERPKAMSDEASEGS